MNQVIAVVSDNAKEREVVTMLLAKHGYQTREIALYPAQPVHTRRDALDLIILDYPSLRAREDYVLKWIHEWWHVPILVLSPHPEPELGIRLLDAGADDVVFKPFRRDELVARVRALLRRMALFSGRQDHRMIQVEGLTIDLTARRAFVDRKDLRLTRKEFALLAELALRANTICTHDELLAKVWGGEYWGANHYLHVYFGRIRRKLGPKYSNLLETIPGMGYLLNAPVPEPRAAAFAS